MLDRLLKLIVVLTLALFLVQAVIGMLIRVVEGMLSQVAGAFGRAGGAVGSVLFALAGVAFVIGLLMRGIRFIGDRDPKVARERAARERAMRQRVRRPAEGVPPVNNQRAHLADPDPAVGDDEEVR